MWTDVHSEIGLDLCQTIFVVVKWHKYIPTRMQQKITKKGKLISMFLPFLPFYEVYRCTNACLGYISTIYFTILLMDPFEGFSSIAASMMS